MELDPSYNVNKHRSSYLTLYAVHKGVEGILVQTVIQKIEDTPETRKRLVIYFAAVIMNVVSALWVFTASPAGNMKHNHWKSIFLYAIFLFTGFLPLYLAFSMLMPEWFTLQRFILICITVAIIGGIYVLQVMLSWCHKKFVVAVKYVIHKFMALIFRSQVQMDGII